ncbi:hypothetical protein ABID22_000106 [Pontibacter aydingkolensis]|uniref:Uncharacterized protein n=1 Tax=Pontibacter aydingkolensis TaxID=1911536 RepID=A0ABS7CQU7_9BACT|nr:hypothetical protein [Pontibacter aydingkolensis]MBW7466224.1 hypothetical protein [Pontibacter aydingkolensis]
MNKLQGLVTIRLGMPDADFYIKRKGAEKTVGQPTDEYSKEYYGVKVNREFLVPRYFYYVIMHLHQQGHFQRHAKGTLRLQHITLDDLHEAIYTGMVQMRKRD